MLDHRYANGVRGTGLHFAGQARYFAWRRILDGGRERIFFFLHASLFDARFDLSFRVLEKNFWIRSIFFFFFFFWKDCVEVIVHPSI